jgi:L-gulonate 3-dehydrogenase
MSRIGIVGAGLIGRAWAIVFARSGFDVALWDGDTKVLSAALGTIGERLDDLKKAGLIADPASALKRIAPCQTLGEAIADAVYVQENLPETVEMKQRIFAEMDALARPGAILASSTSSIPASAFTESLTGREPFGEITVLSARTDAAPTRTSEMAVAMSFFIFVFSFIME